MSPDDPRHGTRPGYSQHISDGEKACEPCRRANATYHQRYRANHPEYVEKNQRRAKAYERAMQRLARENPGRFKTLYREEREREKQA